MSLKCGIVGLPNVGKSTLFNCLTKAQVSAENYPFCTIDPNVGVVTVPDPRLEKIAALVHPERILPTTVEFVDIAGLVKGAAQGEGLGNKFLAHIRETDAILHVVRCFEDSNIVHVSGKIAPHEDIEIINTELALADLDTVTRSMQRMQKQVKSGDKTILAEISLLEKLKQHLNQGQPARSLVQTSEENLMLRSLQLLTMKPILYVANVADNGFTHNPLLQQIEAHAKQENAS